MLLPIPGCTLEKLKTVEAGVDVAVLLLLLLLLLGCEDSLEAVPALMTEVNEVWDELGSKEGVVVTGGVPTPKQGVSGCEETLVLLVLLLGVPRLRVDNPFDDPTR